MILFSWFAGMIPNGINTNQIPDVKFVLNPGNSVQRAQYGCVTTLPQLVCISVHLKVKVNISGLTFHSYDHSFPIRSPFYFTLNNLTRAITHTASSVIGANQYSLTVKKAPTTYRDLDIETKLNVDLCSQSVILQTTKVKTVLPPKRQHRQAEFSVTVSGSTGTIDSSLAQTTFSLDLLIIFMVIRTTKNTLAFLRLKIQSYVWLSNCSTPKLLSELENGQHQWIMSPMIA